MLALLFVLALPGRDIVVTPTGPVRTVAQAVALARAGDTITVEPGNYPTGNVTIAVPGLTLRGRGWPVLDGEGKHEILILAADGLTVRHLVLRGAGVNMTRDQAAVKVLAVKNCRVLDTRIEGSFFGVYLQRSSGCRVAGNVIRGNGNDEARNGNGIHLWNATGATIDSNVIEGHRDGIYLEFARQVRALGNRSTHNRRYGLHFMFSDDCGYRANQFIENGAGVAVMYSRAVTLEENLFQGTQGPSGYGLLLKEIRDSRISGNAFVGNSVGLYTEGASRNLFTGNRFLDNGWGARLLASSEENRFHNNRFAGNSFDVTTNGRSGSNHFSENRWDRYDGYDLDRDGIGDVPFRPMRRFALLVEQHEAAILLLRSPFADLLDLAESVLPVLTPQSLVDERPLLGAAR